ncbi:hypothetical protein F6R98_11300 [Candidatus Methylospira mobilis]|uniref:Uncharacterized protein n=1 Tax=Candidatus Methylospira mobilis TaxID=1808979 RepID=A0A5Q0BLN5_9GAMM|nr:hypothetical protein F6R98_11300 [Candidatus Methylospira mobilis]
MTKEPKYFATCPHCHTHISTLVRMPIDLYDAEQDKRRVTYVIKCGECSAILKVSD